MIYPDINLIPDVNLIFYCSGLLDLTLMMRYNFISNILEFTDTICLEFVTSLCLIVTGLYKFIVKRTIYFIQIRGIHDKYMISRDVLKGSWFEFLLYLQAKIILS